MEHKKYEYIFMYEESEETRKLARGKQKKYPEGNSQNSEFG